MKTFFATAIFLGSTLASLQPSLAMTVATQESQSLTQTISDHTCNAPARNARCKWYGMPGVHKGPHWLRQTQQGTSHHHTYHHHHKHHKPAMHPASHPSKT